MHERMLASAYVCVLTLSCLFSVARASEPGLVAHYTFDEGGGTTLKDVSGNGNNGEIHGAVYVKSPRGQALRFDGVDDYVELGKAPSLNLNGDLTIEAWVKINVENKPKRHWLIFGDAAGLSVLRNYNLRVDHRNQFRFEWGDNYEWRGVTTDPAFLDGAWRHIAIVIESPTSFYLYVDGRLIKREQTDLAIAKTKGGPFRIGGWRHGHLKGEIDDIRLYSRALSLREILGDAGKADANVHPQFSMEAGFSYHKNAFHAELFCEDATGKGSVMEIRVATPDGNVATSKRIPAAEQTRPGSNRYAVTATLPVNGVKAGDYRVESALVDQRGKSLAAESAVVPCTDRPDWLEARVGVTDEIPPPFEPLKTDKKGEEVCVYPWNRRLVFGRSPFLKSIESAGMQLLTGPVLLNAKVNGGMLKWEARTPEILTSKPSEVVLLQQLTAKRTDLTIQTDIEYDDFMKTDWTFRATEPITLDRLSLALPLDARRARYFYCWPESHSGSLKGDFSSRFKPILWLGDEERGLSWVAESDENWLLTDREKAVQITKGDDEVILRFNLVTKPVHLERGRKLTYTFGLLPTPVRPVETTCWDIRLERQPPYAREYAWLTKKIEGQPALEFYAKKGARALNVWRWWNAFSYTLPLGHEKEFPKLVKACHEQNIKVVPYAIGFLFSEVAPELKYFKDDMLVKPEREWLIDRLPGLEKQMTYWACKKGAWQDFVIATTARCIDEYDIDGVYLDGTTYPPACQNRLHGCGYTRPDGTVGSTYPVFATRQLMKRLYTVVKKRKPDGIVDAHTSGCFNVPTLAFSTSYWNGEQLRPTDHKTDLLPLDRFRTEFMGHNIGVPADLLYYRLQDYKACAGLALLHDVPTRSENERDFALLSAIWRARESFGCKEAKFLPYWKNGEFVKVTPKDCYVSLYHHPKNGVLAVVSNLSRKQSKVDVTFDLHKLGLSQNVLSHDALTQAQVIIDDGKLILDLPSQDWRIIWVKSR